MDHFAFILKKVLDGLLTPVPLMILLLLWALLLMVRSKTRWFGYLVVLLVVALFFVAGYAPLTHRIVSSYENIYPAYVQQESAADYIVVLGNTHQSAQDQPVTSEISATGIVRLTEGLRIYYLNPESKLIFTGYEGLNNDPVSYPEKMRELALALQIPEEDIIVIAGTRDTAEEAAAVAIAFSQEKLVLVTSAMHMARALELFQGQGLEPVAAPTGHLSTSEPLWWSFPSAATIGLSTSWMHEQLGTLWGELLGQIKKVSAQDEP